LACSIGQNENLFALPALVAAVNAFLTVGFGSAGSTIAAKDASIMATSTNATYCNRLCEKIHYAG
jgi:formylmethanofuran:tetrahydromethanopterin formyltransferase